MTNENGKTAVDSNEVKEEIVQRYPVKTGRKRAKQLLVNSPSAEPKQTMGANVRTIPGIITQRGCTYAGCKGVVLGPTRDILNHLRSSLSVPSSSESFWRCRARGSPFL